MIWLASLLTVFSIANTSVAVIDGDTVVVNGKSHVRLLGFDAPEIHKGLEGYKCDAELALGLQAKAKMQDLTSPPHKLRFSYAPRRDKYGRRLAKLYSDNQDVAVTMIAAGLAHAYNGKGQRGGWCSG